MGRQAAGAFVRIFTKKVAEPLRGISWSGCVQQSARGQQARAAEEPRRGLHVELFAHPYLENPPDGRAVAFHLNSTAASFQAWLSHFVSLDYGPAESRILELQ